MRTILFLRAGFLLMLFSLTGFTAAAELAVIVSTKNPINSLRVEQVTDIFLGKTSSFPGGGEATPIDLTIDSALREEFYTKVAGKTPPLMKAYWSKMLFTGKGQPPKEASNSAAVKKLVAENPNLIGYIDKNSVDANVKVIFVVH